MRFCAVLRTYPKDSPGGAEYQAYLICRELARRGHETHYVAHQSDTASMTEDDGITVHRLEASTARRDVVRTLADVNADTYYFRLAPDLPLLWLAMRRLDATFVYNVSRTAQCHPLFAPGPTERTGGLLDAVATGRFAVYRWLLRSPDEIFAQTREQQALLERHHGLASTLVGNGHPIPNRNGEKPAPPIVLWLANIKSVKNPKTFLRLVDDLEDLKCHFCMVGRPVDDDLHRYVRQTEREHDNFEYHGGCDIFESNDYFARASVYVHTGESEGFPNTFIQSWLHRTPVVSLCTDPEGVLRDNDVGVHAESYAEARNQVARLIEDSEFRNRLGRRAREYGVEYHSIDAVVDRVERRIETLTSNDER